MTINRTLVAMFALAVTAGVANAGKILVMRADGNADAATKTKIDAQVVRLAKSGDPGADAGEITFSDAAAAVGCSGTEAQCRDDVLGTLGVDEVVSVTVTTLPSGDVRVAVHRIPKTGGIKEAQSTIPVGQSAEAKLGSDIGPVFGLKKTAPPPATTATTPPPATTPAGQGSAGAPVGAWGNAPATTPPPTVGVGPAPAGTAQGGVAVAPTETHAPAPTQTAQVDPNNPTVTGAPNGQVPPAEHRSSNRATAGLAVGGGLVLLAIIMWAEASSVQNDINNAPVKTSQDFKNLKDLESRGDTYTGVGNLFFVGGVVVGGISGYYFWKARRQSSAQASIAPTVIDHGAGVVLTVGGL